MRRIEFAARLILIYAAGFLAAIGDDGARVAPFAVASMFFTAELATRGRGRDGIDRVARIAGSVLVALVLGGLIVNLTPEGLTRQSWSAFWVLISLAVLWWKRREATSVAWLQARPTSQFVYVTMAVAVFAGAAVVATNGANNNLHSPLQMWVQGKSPGSITVAVSSGTAGGPYRIVMDPEVTKTEAFDPFTVDATRPVEVGLPAGPNTRYSIHLVDVASGTKVRTVIVDSPAIS